MFLYNLVTQQMQVTQNSTVFPAVSTMCLLPWYVVINICFRKVRIYPISSLFFSALSTI